MVKEGKQYRSVEARLIEHQQGEIVKYISFSTYRQYNTILAVSSLFPGTNSGDFFFLPFLPFPCPPLASACFFNSSCSNFSLFSAIAFHSVSSSSNKGLLAHRVLTQLSVKLCPLGTEQEMGFVKIKVLEPKMKIDRWRYTPYMQTNRRSPPRYGLYLGLITKVVKGSSIFQIVPINSE